MNDGLLNMVTHGIGRTNRVASLTGGKNRAMFPIQTLCIFGNVGRCIEMIVGDRGIAQFVNHREQPRTSPKAIQAQVELVIQLNIACRIAGGVQFAPDGRSVAYPIRDNGVDNIWVQPLDGAAGRQITYFKSDQISEFHWSPDGKSLGILQNHTDSDVVLMHDKGSSQ